MISISLQHVYLSGRRIRGGEARVGGDGREGGDSGTSRRRKGNGIKGKHFICTRGRVEVQLSRKKERVIPVEGMSFTTNLRL